MSLLEIANPSIRPNAYLGTAIASSVNADGGMVGAPGALAATVNDVSAPDGTSGIELAAIGNVDAGYGNTNAAQIRVIAKAGEAARGEDFAAIVIPTTDTAVAGMAAGDVSIAYNMVVDGNLTVNGELIAADRAGTAFTGTVNIPSSASTTLFQKTYTIIPDGETLIVGLQMASPAFSTTADFDPALHGAEITIESRNPGGDILSSVTYSGGSSWLASQSDLSIEPSTNATSASDFNVFLALTPECPIVTVSVTTTEEVTGVQPADENPIRVFPLNMSVFTSS